MPQKIKKISSILPFTIQDRWYALPVEMIEAVTPISRITSIPGNKSRAFKGLGYMLGQVMSVIDCAPIVNLGLSRDARQCIVVRHQGAYYALVAGQVGQLIANPRLETYKRPLTSFTLTYVDYQKKKITLIQVATLIEDHICR